MTKKTFISTYDVPKILDEEVSEIPIKRQSKFEDEISNVVNSVKTLLVEKNKKYGNSALEPINIFVNPKAKADALTLINSRIDDKLSRIRQMTLNPELFECDQEDTVDDLIGYLILRKIKLARMNEKKFFNVGIASSAKFDVGYTVK